MQQSKFLYLLYFCSLSLLFSCSSDDETIAGTYKVLSFTSSGCTDPLDNFSFDFSADDGCTIFLGEEVCGDGTITLTESGNFTFSMTVTAANQSFSENASGTYTVDGNTITICDADDCESSTFTLGSGNITIRFSESGDSCVNTITGEKI